MEDEYLDRTGGDSGATISVSAINVHTHIYFNSLAAGESNQSVREDVDPERVVARHIDVDPQVELVATDEVGLVKVPEKKEKVHPRDGGSSWWFPT